MVTVLGWAMWVGTQKTKIESHSRRLDKLEEDKDKTDIVLTEIKVSLARIETTLHEMWKK